MRKYAAVAIVGLVCCMASGSYAQAVDLTPNTVFFTVQNYHVLNRNGDYEPFRASGFYIPGVGNVPPRVFLLPRINIGDIRYYDEDGRPVDPTTD